MSEVQNEMEEGSEYGYKRQYKRSLILFYLDCSGGYTSLRVIKSHRSVDTCTHKQVQGKLGKSQKVRRAVFDGISVTLLVVMLYYNLDTGRQFNPRTGTESPG